MELGSWSLVLFCCLFLGACNLTTAADRPAHMANNQRTGVTAEQLANKVQARTRATAATVWTKDAERPSSMITGGTTLYVGAKNQVLCLGTANGALLKSLPAPGDVFCPGAGQWPAVCEHHARRDSLLRAVGKSKSQNPNSKEDPILTPGGPATGPIGI